MALFHRLFNQTKACVVSTVSTTDGKAEVEAESVISTKQRGAALVADHTGSIAASMSMLHSITLKYSMLKITSA